MSNEYYDHTTFPTPGSPGSSAALRAELDLIEVGFSKMPILTGNGGKFVAVNSAGTALEASTALQLSGSGTLSAASMELTGTPTAPTAAPGTNTTQVATTAFVTAAEFNTALPDQTGNAGKFVTTDGTNASWDVASPSLTAIATGTLSDGSTVIVNSDGTVSVVSGNPTS